MQACCCTNQCKKCGACCQSGCGCYSGQHLIAWPDSTPPMVSTETTTCPTCKGSGKVKPA